MEGKVLLRVTLGAAWPRRYPWPMSDADLNLLAALDVLLAEGSVTRAARRLGLSDSAMSRTLTRLREATGDPLLVRAGRGLVPTPRANALRDPVHALTREARAVLRPQSDRLDLRTLDATFTIRASEGFLELLSGRVSRAITDAAPLARLRFVAKPDCRCSIASGRSSRSRGRPCGKVRARDPDPAPLPRRGDRHRAHRAQARGQGRDHAAALCVLRPCCGVTRRTCEPRP